MHHRIAIVGAGPCGLYLAKNLRGRLSSDGRIDIFERLSQPLGLLRFGVAPDSITVRRSGDVLLKGSKERFFFNVRVGGELSIDELLRYYHVCLLSCGAESPRPFPIPGDNCQGVFNALDVIRSYNGHPEAPRGVIAYMSRLADLGRRIKVCVIGNGNVALDIARILLTPAESLEKLEINRDFLGTLRNIDISAVTLIGRRGIFQSSFTNPELSRILKEGQFLPFTTSESYEQSLLHKPAELDRRQKRKLDLFTTIASNATYAQSSAKTLEFSFFRSVGQVIGGPSSSIETVVLSHNTLDANLVAHSTQESTTVEADLLIKCVGFQRSADTENLLKRADSKRIFSCGWAATSGKGDLSNTLAETIKLSRAVSSMKFDFPVEEDINQLFQSDTRFKNVSLGRFG